MSFLDNIEAYMDIKETKDKCYYCQALATYNDIAEVDRNYQIVGVCACHSYKGLVS